MIWTAVIIMLLTIAIFWCGAQYAINRIMKNMMKDLVEVKDMMRWLRVWT